MCVCAYIYQNKRTPLHYAAEGGHGKIVETLLEAKADLCAQDKVSVLKETRLDADRGMR
jgi:ankyrin repeat protein